MITNNPNATENANAVDNFVYEVLFQQAAIGIAQIDLNSHFIKANPYYCHITGYSEEELIGKSFQQITYEADIYHDQVLFERTLKGRKDKFSMEKRYIKKDGSLVWVLLSASLVRDSEDNPLYFVSTVQDISELKKVEQQLRDLSSELGMRVARKSRRLEGLVEVLEVEIKGREKVQSALVRRDAELNMIMDSVPAAIIYVDNQQRCLFCNATFASWLEKDIVQIAHRAVDDILGEETYRLLSESLEKCLQGTREDFDIFFPASRSVNHVNIVALPDYAAAGSVRGSILMLTDITPRVEQKKKLEADSQQKSSLLAHVSHEFRTPLGIILGYSDLLLEDLESGNTALLRQWLEAIRSNGNSLLKLVNDHLDYSRLETGKIDIELQDVILVDQIRSVVTDLAIVAREKNTDITVRYSNDLPEKIYTDPCQLRQILLNILGNAVKFTENGAVNITLDKQQINPSSADRSVCHEKIAITISDTGIGISEEQASKLFTPFTQAHTGISKKFGGSGLGLTLAQKMAQTLGGNVFLQESTHGKGSTFVILISACMKEQSARDSQ